MTQDIFAQAAEQFTKLSAPAKQLNSLVVAHIEKLAQFQLEAAKAYTDTGIGQLRSALDVNDAKSLQDYVANQQKVAEAVAAKLKADAEALVQLNQGFAGQVQKLAQEGVATATAATAAAKPARKTASA